MKTKKSIAWIAMIIATMMFTSCRYEKGDYLEPNKVKSIKSQEFLSDSARAQMMRYFDAIGPGQNIDIANCLIWRKVSDFPDVPQNVFLDMKTYYNKVYYRIYEKDGVQSWGRDTTYYILDKETSTTSATFRTAPQKTFKLTFLTPDLKKGYTEITEDKCDDGVMALLIVLMVIMSIILFFCFWWLNWGAIIPAALWAVLCIIMIYNTSGIFVYIMAGVLFVCIVAGIIMYLWDLKKLKKKRAAQQQKKTNS